MMLLLMYWNLNLRSICVFYLMQLSELVRWIFLISNLPLLMIWNILLKQIHCIRRLVEVRLLLHNWIHIIIALSKMLVSLEWLTALLSLHLRLSDFLNCVQDFKLQHQLYFFQRSIISTHFAFLILVNLKILLGSSEIALTWLVWLKHRIGKMVLLRLLRFLIRRFKNWLQNC